jgi:Mg-chelatase subunit ChlI
MPSDRFFEDFLTKIKTLNHKILREAGEDLQVWKLGNPRRSRDIREEGYLTNLRRLASSEEGEQDQSQEQEQGQVQAPQGDEDEEDEEKRKREKSKGKGKEKEKPKEKKGDVAWPLDLDEAISLHPSLEEPEDLSQATISILVQLVLPAGGTSCCVISTARVSNNQR